ncbi:putative membrane-bound O-acyltransferase isoform X1, partial [Tanacetum coccineum]
MAYEVVFTFVAIWHDLEWKLLSWAWLTCIFFIPEMLVKSVATSVKVDNAIKESGMSYGVLPFFSSQFYNFDIDRRVNLLLSVVGDIK